MRCPSCGFPIEQQNSDHCPQCGRSLTASAEPHEAGSASLAGPSNPTPSGEPVAPAAADAADAATPTPVNPYAPYPPYGQPGVYPPQPGGYGQPYGQPAPPSYPMAPSYPPPSGYYQSAYPPMGYVQPPYAQPSYAPPAQRKSHVGLIVGIVAAVVVVLAVCTCGVIFAVQSLAHVPAIRSFPTIPAYTPTPAATPTAIPVRTVIYQNTFASGADGWSTDTSNCFWKSDGYHVINNYECYAPTGVQTSVDISVRAQQLSGATNEPYGIVFALDGQNNDYEFMIDSDSEWVLFKCGANSCDPVVDYTSSDAILGGLHTSNRLEALVQGTHFEFYVNGTLVGSYDDPGYVSGRVGVSVGDKIECAFTDFVVSRP